MRSLLSTPARPAAGRSPTPAAREAVIAILRPGDTGGNVPGSKWWAGNAIASSPTTTAGTERPRADGRARWRTPPTSARRTTSARCSTTARSTSATGSAGRSARCASSIPAPELDPWAAGCAPARTPPHGRKPSGVRMTTLIQGVYLRRSVCVRRGSIAECRSGTGAPPENALVPSPDPRHPRRIPCPPEPSTTTAGLLRLRVRSVFVWSGGGAPWLRAGARARGTRWVVRPSPAAGARRRACS
jgi:hypothetical protein